MIKFNAGEFRTKIEIYKDTTIKDSDGLPLTEFKLLKSVKAKVKAVRGREYNDVQIDTKLFYTRYIDIDNNCIIKLLDDYYHIEYIDNIECRGRYLEIKGVLKKDVKNTRVK